MTIALRTQQIIGYESGVDRVVDPLAGSYVIGDKRADLELADAIGATGILLTTGHGRDAVDFARTGARPVFGGLDQAARFIVGRGIEVPS